MDNASPLATGLSQHSPFTQVPQPPGQVPQASPPPSAPIGAPNVPPDATMQMWRTAQNPRGLGQPYTPGGQPEMGGPVQPPAQISPLQAAIRGNSPPPPSLPVTSLMMALQQHLGTSYGG